MLAASRGLQSSSFRSTGSDEGRLRRQKQLQMLSSNCRSQSELLSEGELPRDRVEGQLLQVDVKIKDSESFKLAAESVVQSRILVNEPHRQQVASQQ